ncbi:MAG: aspartate kinase, partial [Bdellovibrionales bacterium]|nr:aspartate kinase [Bdellovibrionales bacterium]
IMKNHSPIMVKKFGGTSVGSIERIEAVAERVLADAQSGEKPIVVASAMSGETNRLVRLANDIDPFYRGPAYDMLVASGEQVSIALLAIALEKRGGKAVPLLAHQLGIHTDSIFSKARITSVNTEKLMSYVNQGIIPIVAGFQGVTDGDKITTLGRGGSDTTAVALAAALDSGVCEIYTDVPAVYSADPRMVPEARELPLLSFEEMMEMASLGSKVLHFRSVELAAKYNVKIHLRSTFETREGTWVVPEGEKMEAPVVSSITHDAATVVLKLFPVPFGSGFMAQLFETLAEKGVVVDIITQSHNEEGQRVAFSVREEDLNPAVEVVKGLVGKETTVTRMETMAKISAVGVGMANHPGVAARFFRVLDRLSIPIHLVTTSDIKISAVIDRDNLPDAAKALHTEFGLDRE